MTALGLPVRLACFIFLVAMFAPFVFIGALLGLSDEVGPGYKLIVSDGWRWVKEGAE